jgi:hypothetical protein
MDILAQIGTFVLSLNLHHLNDLANTLIFSRPDDTQSSISNANAPSLGKVNNYKRVTSAGMIMHLTLTGDVGNA